MQINIKKYAEISYIAINEIEKKDIEKGVLDILNYVYILKNITVKDTNNRDNDSLISRYRIPIEKTDLKKKYKEILFENAPKFIQNYFIVPDLIIRKS